MDTFDLTLDPEAIAKLTEIAREHWGHGDDFLAVNEDPDDEDQVQYISFWCEVEGRDLFRLWPVERRATCQVCGEPAYVYDVDISMWLCEYDYDRVT